MLILSLRGWVGLTALLLFLSPLLMQNALAGISGLDYGPFREGQSPEGAQPTPEQLREDMTTLSRMTHTIRTYSVTHGLDAIVGNADNVGLDVVPTAFLNNERLYTWASAENQAQVNNLIALLNEGRDNVPFAVVGNEAVKLQGFTPEELIKRINKVRAKVPHSVILTTAETWDIYLAHPELVAVVDVIFVNIHPYFDNQVVVYAADYVIARYEELKAAYPGKEVIISETGWPTAGGANSGGGKPSSENQEFFLRDFWHAATLQDIPFFVFEAFDEPWKATTELNGVGDHWGLYDSARQPKHDLVSLIPLQGTGGPDAIAGKRTNGSDPSRQR